jgi:predicted O-linked N-acetylglucosamine transferase (SPINDLY family)
MVDTSLFVKASELHQAGRLDEARDFYERMLTAHANHALSRLHLAVIDHQQGDTRSALKNVDIALAIDPDLVPAHRSRGIFSIALQDFHQALTSFDRAIALSPHDPALHRHRGAVLEILKRYPEAMQSYAKALDLDPETPLALGNCLHIAQRLCDWRDWYELVALILTRAEAGRPASSPLLLHLLPSTLTQQLQASQSYFRFTTDSLTQMELLPTKRREKIRVGYFSADFCNHAVALAIAELFEMHDKTHFEISAFLLTHRKNDTVQQRLRRAFDHFIDVSALSDIEAVKIAREMQIDIAVDLMGYTSYSRPGIFAMRAAPVQVSYLGYPGTMGADCIDYIFADKTVLPEEHRPYFTERICYLPHSYQANDSKRAISEMKSTRSELGLPDTGTVFCCFNINHKITPDTFDSWMRILHRVPGSVLWLYSTNKIATENLRNETMQRGIAPERIVFAPFLDMPEHLARHQAADLFLDTLHYGGHGTASHALWAGLPVLTRLGSTFPSRVAASLLKALDLPELIAANTAEYEDMAAMLATEPDKLAALKQRLKENRRTSPLFDTPRFARYVETAYQTMMERHWAGEKPQDLYISDAP